MSKLTWDIAVILLLSSLKRKYFLWKGSDFERGMIKYNTDLFQKCYAADVVHAHLISTSKMPWCSHF